MDSYKLHEKDGENNEDQTGDGRGNDFLALVEFVGDTGRSSDDEDAIEDEKQGDPAAETNDDAKEASNETTAFSIERDTAKSSVDALAAITIGIGSSAGGCAFDAASCSRRTVSFGSVSFAAE